MDLYIIYRIRRLILFFPEFTPLAAGFQVVLLLARSSASAATRPCWRQASCPACNGWKHRLICWGMYCPRRAGRGTTSARSLPTRGRRVLFVCAWCAGYSASDGIRTEARTTVCRWSSWHRVCFAGASIKEHPFRRDPASPARSGWPRGWPFIVEVRPIASCATPLSKSVSDTTPRSPKRYLGYPPLNSC